MEVKMQRLTTRALLFVILSFAGLTTVSPETDSGQQEKTFTIGLGEQTLSYHPWHAHTSTDIQILTALYEGLVTYHPLTLETLPGCAYKWEISEDKTIYKFYLREDARYSNGDAVTAEHFRDSFLQILRPEEGAEYSVYLDVIKGATAFRNGKSTDPAGDRKSTRLNSSHT